MYLKITTTTTTTTKDVLVIPSSTNIPDERTSTPNRAHTTVTFMADRTPSLPTPV